MAERVEQERRTQGRRPWRRHKAEDSNLGDRPHFCDPIRALGTPLQSPEWTLRAEEENRAAVTGVEVPGNIPTVGAWSRKAEEERVERLPRRAAEEDLGWGNVCKMQ